MIDNEFWVFGYGSLVWNPGFNYAEKSVARLRGYDRSFCMRSIHHRGSETDPGLVLALDRSPGEYCDGVAFRVDARDAGTTLQYLRDRELISSAYVEVTEEITLDDGRVVAALCYVIDADHVQYCKGLKPEEQARIIAEAVGGRGPNSEYLYQTAAHLREFGIQDADLNWLESRVRRLRQSS